RYAFALSTFPIDVQKTESKVKKHLQGGTKHCLPLPHPRLANFDEYLTNSHIFNVVDFYAVSGQNAL
ncbi:MAG: hypothetical protein WBE74_19155, partial [Terracidiphilus sp.]